MNEQRNCLNLYNWRKTGRRKKLTCSLRLHRCTVDTTLESKSGLVLTHKPQCFQLYGPYEKANLLYCLIFFFFFLITLIKEATLYLKIVL